MIAASDIAAAANDGTLTTQMIEHILNDNGIIFINLKKLDSTPIDAYSVRIGKNPTIVATYRHNNMDKPAFDILHEIGHIQMHLSEGKSFISVEADYSSRSTEEREADEFARNTLIKPEVWRSIISTGSKSLSPHSIVHTIAEEAKRHGISRTIAVARYKHDTKYYNIRGYASPKIITK